MRRAFGACSFVEHEPGALPRAGMTDAFGVMSRTIYTHAKRTSGCSPPVRGDTISLFSSAYHPVGFKPTGQRPDSYQPGATPRVHSRGLVCRLKACFSENLFQFSRCRNEPSNVFYFVRDPRSFRIATDADRADFFGLQTSALVWRGPAFPKCRRAE